MLSDSTVTTLVKLLVIGLLAITIVSTFLTGRQAGLLAALPGLIGVYIAVVLAAGVFLTGLLDPRFQVALALGLVAFGISTYLTGSDLIGALLSAVGLFWLGTKGRELAG